MTIGNTVKTNKGIGHIKWIDNPWKKEDGTDADILVKVTIDKNDHWFRFSELEKTEIEERKIIVKRETSNNMKELIEFNEFLEISKKLEIKTGQITHFENVPKSEKLLKLTVDFGEENPRTVVTNIKPLLATITGELSKRGGLIGLKMLFVTNLKPVKMMGIESTAMIMPGELEKSLLVTLDAKNGVSMI